MPLQVRVHPLPADTDSLSARYRRTDLERRGLRDFSAERPDELIEVVGEHSCVVAGL